MADDLTASAGEANATGALADWLAHLADERRASPRTVQAYGDAVGRYIGFLQRHRGEALSLTALGGVEAAELRAFLAFRRSGERPLGARSIAQSLSAIRTFHRWPAACWRRPAPTPISPSGRRRGTRRCLPCSTAAACAFPRPCR
jgi:site-specific recombinase XerD